MLISDMRNNLSMKIFFILLCLTILANAQQNISTRTNLNPLGNFGNNILDSVKGNNLYFHVAGVASTAILVTSDADYYINKYFNEHE